MELRVTIITYITNKSLNFVLTSPWFSNFPPIVWIVNFLQFYSFSGNGPISGKRLLLVDD